MVSIAMQPTNRPCMFYTIDKNYTVHLTIIIRPIDAVNLCYDFEVTREEQKRLENDILNYSAVENDRR